MPATTRRERANAIRFLAMDAVQKANSGHPGMPMGMADIAEVLWYDFLRHDPKNPHWMNKDRFILSNGHGCMLQYALLHLTGYDLTIEDLKQFRQLHSKTPGHPEFGETPGIETTTGPLGQGLANAVGMAVAEKHLASVFNRPGFPIIDHYTYCFVGDGCLMEGISHEVSSLAGTLGLGKLIVFYDDNGISIDGQVSTWFSDNTPERFAAYHWHVVPNVDGHAPEAIRAAIIAAQEVTDKPSIICLKTVIGWGAPTLAGSASTHGAALGEKEIMAVRSHLNWPYAPFVIPEAIYASWDAREKGKELEGAWQQLFKDYQKAYPELAQECLRRFENKLPLNWREEADKLLHQLNEQQQSIATRKASQQCLNHYANGLPEMMGGSADLTESNCTNWKDVSVFTKDTPAGRYIHYGVREFGMSAMMNGMALHRGLLPFGGTFLTFSDYARNAIRLAAMMKARVIFVYTHDSIGLGEDGPTHQPVEHLPSLRAIPQLSIWRPCDTVETAVAWRMAIERQGPTCLLLSRQNLAFQARNREQLQMIERGGYILWENPEGKEAEVILIATGSEVSLAVEAAKGLFAEAVAVRVVSMPSMDIFLSQTATYQQTVLPPNIPKIAIEAAASGGDWYRFIGSEGKMIGLTHFGASAPAKDVFKACGFTVSNIMAAAKEGIQSASSASQLKAKWA